jgi:ABC-type Na+ efflux pump permease subunit
VIAAKEFADNLLSVRFFVLLVLLGLAAVAAVSTAASAIKDAASGASGTPSAFLLLFTAAPGAIPSFVSLVGFLGPLLGIAFAFDAITGERSQRTLPRLVSQPVHRDDVINGKFVAGLAAVAVSVIAVMLVVAGVGIFVRGSLVAAGTIDELAERHGGRIVIEVATSHGDPSSILRRLPGVIEVQRDGDVWAVGTQQDISGDIAGALTRAGLTVVHLRRRSEELATLYRRYFTQGMS